jgi:hypothetical protein
MTKGTLKKCPSCGKLFGCQGEEDCWCESMQIQKKNMLTIMNTYTDCICKDCLQKFAE